jgi:RNA polymerase sigma factor (sigma-70 family)
MATIPSEVAHEVRARFQTLDPPTWAPEPEAYIQQVLREFAASQQSLGSESESKRQRVMEALEKLPPLQRAVLVLNRCHGMSCEDIAQRVGIPVLTVQRAFASGLQLYVQHVIG